MNRSLKKLYKKINNINNIIMDFEKSIYLYSGYYDFNKNYKFIVDDNFYYISELNIPNFCIVYNTKTIEFYYKYQDNKIFDNSYYINMISIF